MNSLDDLRHTLDQHAGAVPPDTAAAVRTVSVRERVRVVRRRRRAAGAAGTAAVLAVVAGVALIPGSTDRSGPQPATPVVGVMPPQTMTALGFGYEFTEGIDGSDGRVSVELDAADQPRLVSWATSGADDEVVVRSPEAQTPVTYDAADFTSHVYVPAGDEAVVDVRVGAGEPGLAVYTLGEGRPDGYTKGGVTYRQSGALGELAGAVVGDPGQVDVSFDAPPAPAGTEGVRIAVFCVSGPDDVVLELEVGGKPVSSLGTSCSGPLDPDGAERVPTAFRIKPGKDVSARLYATQPTDDLADMDGPPVEDDDIVLGIATYTTDSYVTAVKSGESRALVVETDGHRWEKVETVHLGATGGGERTVTSTAPEASGPVMAIVQTDVAGPTEVELGSAGSFVAVSGGEGTAVGVLAGGETVSVTRKNGTFQPGDEKVVSYYVQADR